MISSSNVQYVNPLLTRPAQESHMLFGWCRYQLIPQQLIEELVFLVLSAVIRFETLIVKSEFKNV